MQMTDTQAQVDELLGRILRDARKVMELTRGNTDAGVIPGKASNIVANVTDAGDELRRWVKGVPTAYAQATADAAREMREAREERERRVERKRRPSAAAAPTSPDLFGADAEPYYHPLSMDATVQTSEDLES